jgi:predicted Zn-dependent peptidase
LLLSLENTSTHMWRAVQQEIYFGEHPSLAATLRAIEKLTRDDLQQAARAVYGARPLTLASVGPSAPRFHVKTKKL